MQGLVSPPEQAFPPLLSANFISRCFIPVPVDGDSPSPLQSKFWHSLQSSHSQSTKKINDFLNTMNK